MQADPSHRVPPCPQNNSWLAYLYFIFRGHALDHGPFMEHWTNQQLARARGRGALGGGGRARRGFEGERGG